MPSGDLKRLIKLPKNHSFFLFGARGSGKSTLIKENFAHNSYLIDLLDIETEDRFRTNPGQLKELVKSLDAKISHIIIDEVQKIPRLLDLVHLLIESTDKKFILTGSSARKLKYGQANLLAGRAFVYNLYPFTSIELGKIFDLEQALSWGLLPKIYRLDNDDDKKNFLQSYAFTYLKEEVWTEQLIKNLDPFKNFLEVAAQMNGKIINYTKISKDVGVDDKTVKQYYSILEDTLLGFSLNGFKSSFRKQLSTKPKFYLFDTGVTRALSKTLSIPLKENTYAYGDAFEHFVILEIMKLATYYKADYRFSYLRTKDDAEVDLIVERPGLPHLFLEIKSSKNVRKEDLTNLAMLSKDFKSCEALCFSQDPHPRTVDEIQIMPWQEGLNRYFGAN